MISFKNRNYFPVPNISIAINMAGFRTEHSTEFAALELVDRVMLEMDKKNTPINIVLDLSKAFDTLNHEILLQKLKCYGITGIALNLM